MNDDLYRELNQLYWTYKDFENCMAMDDPGSKIFPLLNDRFSAFLSALARSEAAAGHTQAGDAVPACVRLCDGTHDALQ